MHLSARILTEVCDVNNFKYADTMSFTEDDAPSIYFQLIDTNKDTLNEGFNIPGRRYAPASGATLQVSLLNIDDSKKITRYATQPYPTSDPSIWVLTLFSTDDVKGTMNLNMVLTEGVRVTRGVLQHALTVYPITGARN